MQKILMCLSLITLMGSIGCNRSSSNPKAETAAVTAATEWLSLVDEEKYVESWDEAATLFRNAVPKEKWVQTMEAMRKPFGKNISRELASNSYKTSLPGAPNGEYVVIQFKASFENKKSALETITPMHDKDGKWRISGYFMK